MNVFEPITLASGLQFKNRIVKAAMEENMACERQLPSQAILNLYRAWAHGGAGAIITGNVMIDPLAMTGPGGIALHEKSDLSQFKRWSTISKQSDTKVIMQLNHPGRQTYKNMRGKCLSPSDVALDLGKHSSLFATPTPMTQADIKDVISMFATSASRAEEAGFDGVQIHAAHGYLLSQFLSGRVNKRQDEWGGSIENRTRLLLEVVKAVKQSVSSSFSVSVKLNSADFQRGGFDVDDAKYVVSQLENHHLDFVELSGGSYEAPAMQGRSADERTLSREAYFLKFAEIIAASTSINIMTTGGIRRLSIANEVVNKSVSLVGIATALAFQPDLPNIWKVNPQFSGFTPAVNWNNKAFSALATMAVVRRQLQRLGKQKHPKLNSNALFSLIKDQLRLLRLTKRYRKNVVDSFSI